MTEEMTKVTFNDRLAQCPLCEQNMEKGFFAHGTGLSWITPEKMSHFAFMDKDLVEAGLKIILPSKAEYNLSYHCLTCKVYIVDYSQTVFRKEANALAQMLLQPVA